MRKITVCSTKITGLKTFREEDDLTWGEFKHSLTREGVEHDYFNATVRETRNTLTLDEALLPNGDITIFLSETRSKARGNAWDNMTMHQIRSYAAKNGISAMGSYDDIKSRLNATVTKKAETKVLPFNITEIMSKLDRLTSISQDTNNQISELRDEVEALSETVDSVNEQVTEIANTNPEASSIQNELREISQGY